MLRFCCFFSSSLSSNPSHSALPLQPPPSLWAHPAQQHEAHPKTPHQPSAAHCSDELPDGRGATLPNEEMSSSHTDMCPPDCHQEKPEYSPGSVQGVCKTKQTEHKAVSLSPQRLMLDQAQCGIQCTRRLLMGLVGARGYTVGLSHSSPMPPCPIPSCPIPSCPFPSHPVPSHPIPWDPEGHPGVEDTPCTSQHGAEASPFSYRQGAGLVFKH